MVWLKHVFVGLGILLAIIFMALSHSAAAQTESQESEPVQITTISDYSLPADLQTDLPQVAPKTVAERRQRSNWFSRFLNAIAPFLELIFWMGVALIVALIAYFIGREVYFASKRRTPTQESEEDEEVIHYQPDAETARVVLDDAERLASEGKFDEAVHTLLFRSIQDITDKRPSAITRALTSREIAGLPILTPSAKSAFATIGQLVETSFFGGLGLGRNDFERAKSAYKNFAYEKLAR